MKNKEQQKQKRLEQKRRYRQTHKTFTLSYRLEDAKTLHNHVKSKGWNNVPSYLKSLVTADLKNMGVVLPPNHQFVELIFALHKIGGNINQLVRYVHAARQVDIQDIIKLQEHLKQIEQSVEQTIKNPIAVELWLANFLKKHPHKRQTLLTYLNRYGD
jgi:hypothetical protein